MSTFGEHVRSLALARKQAGFPVNWTWIAETIDRELAGWRREPRESDADTLFSAYPNRVSRQSALIAINASLKVKSFEYLLARTKEYAECVSRWPTQYRYHQETGRDLCPTPATWFRDGRYDDDPETWRRIGGRTLPDTTQASFSLPEPSGWKEWVTSNTSFDIEGKTWSDLEPPHQRYIAEQMKKPPTPIPAQKWEDTFSKALDEKTMG